jgi:beta-N-acetylhexosaminidase
MIGNRPQPGSGIGLRGILTAWTLAFVLFAGRGTAEPRQGAQVIYDPPTRPADSSQAAAGSGPSDPTAPRSDEPTPLSGADAKPPPSVKLNKDVLLAKKAGQMIFVGFRGASLTDYSVQRLIDEIKAGEVGGVFYADLNIKSLGAVSDMNRAFAEAAQTARLMPPFIGVDQEGGSVQRLRAGVGVRGYPSAAAVASKFSSSEARQLYAEMAKTLADDGFNVNFGPVVDLNINPNNPIIGRYGRSFGKDVHTVDDFAKAFISAHRQAGVLTALKHFPGHGSSVTDSHKGFVDITRTWNRIELAPYQELINANLVDFIMVGHLYDQFHQVYGDTGLIPASLSGGWITMELRKELCFTGVVISDDLEMGAIRQEFSTEDTVIRAVNAGVDVLLFSNSTRYDPALASKIWAILVDKANADRDFAKRIEQSYDRIEKLKERLVKLREDRGTIDPSASEVAPLAADNSHLDVPAKAPTPPENSPAPTAAGETPVPETSAAPFVKLEPISPENAASLQRRGSCAQN